jgi:ACS family hexuronate transporter-like MFS transporter
MHRTRYFKWIVCGLLFLAVTVLYVDRQALSIVAPQLTSVFGWSETDYGNMVSAYQLAYAVGVFGVGWLADRLGTRFAFGVFVVLWESGDGRARMGRRRAGVRCGAFRARSGAVGVFPCAIKATAEWFPKEERALATGLFNCGSMLGPILAPLAILFLYTRHGWLATCAVLGAAGIVWGAVWLTLYRVPSVSALPRGLGADSGKEEPVPLATLLRCRATWAFFVGKLLSDPVWWFFLYWLPKFLHDRHGLDLINLGVPLVAIYSITIIGSVGAGWLTQHLSRRGMAVQSARKTVMLLCALLPVPF